MNDARRRRQKGLLCTCNDLFIDEIQASIQAGAEDAEEVMVDHDTMYRCTECRPMIQALMNHTPARAK